jgi:mannose-6-phosphate isomerase-like protein (cupin superfamily)
VFPLFTHDLVLFSVKDYNPKAGRRIAADSSAAAMSRKEVMMSGYSVDLEKAALDNAYFRKVLVTAPHSQLVVMALQPGEDIGLETHEDTDQFIRVEAGEGKAIIGGQEHPLKDGSAIVIPAGSAHNVINMSRTKPLKLYTIYTPPEHADGTVHRTKAEAEAAHHDH